MTDPWFWLCDDMRVGKLSSRVRQLVSTAVPAPYLVLSSGIFSKLHWLIAASFRTAGSRRP